MGDTVVVAMDGPPGSGKSSTSRGVADRLGLRYLDTGAQFRAMTVWMLRHGIDIHDAAAVAAHAAAPVLVSGTDPLDPTITLDGEDVAEAIRSAGGRRQRSARSRPSRRSGPGCSTLQRAIIAEALADGGIVVEGRDIGSVVWPEAEVKLYLTADPAARAARRTAENGSGSVAATEAELLAPRRDRLLPHRCSAGRPRRVRSTWTPRRTTSTR